MCAWVCVTCCLVCFCACRSQCSRMSWPVVLLKQVLLMASRWKRSCRSWVRLHMFPSVIYLMWHSSTSAGLWCSVSLLNTNTSILMVSRSSKGAVVHGFSFLLSVANKREQKAKESKGISYTYEHTTHSLFFALIQQRSPN